MAPSRLAFLALPAATPLRHARVRPVAAPGRRRRPRRHGLAVVALAAGHSAASPLSSSSSSSSPAPPPPPAATPTSPPVPTDRERVLQRQASIAGSHWARALRSGDTVIDATCGRGRDTLRLAQLLALAYSQGGASAAGDGDAPPAGGRVVAMDIQPDAVADTRALVEAALPDLVAQPVLPTLEYVCRSHVEFGGLGLAPASVGLVAYNLGYLPGDNVDRTVTTTADTTVASLSAAAELVRIGGLITVVCYCGHEGGAEEETAVTTWAAELPKHEWSALAMQWLNRENSPSLLLLERTR